MTSDQEDDYSYKVEVRRARSYAKNNKATSKQQVGTAKLLRSRSWPYKTKNLPSRGSVMKYTLPGYQPQKIRTLHNDFLLLPYRMYIKNESQKENKMRRQISLTKSYKVKTTDLKQRLCLGEEVCEVHTIKDIDENFFTAADGRPLQHRSPLFKSLKGQFDKLLRLKQDIGYRRDCVLNIDTSMERELKTYQTSLKRCKDQAKYFESFISTDYLYSMAFLSKWEALKLKLDMKVKELHSLAFEKFTIISRLIGLDHKFRVQQKYGRFLYYLSPPSWRANHREFARSIEIETKGFDLGNSNETDNFSVIFENLVQDCYSEHVKPVIYFNSPKELMDVFETIEKQQLHYFSHVTHITPFIQKIKDTTNTMRNYIIQDTASVVGTIEQFKQQVSRSEQQADELKAKFFRILNGLFYESVASPDVIKLALHLEFCFEQFYGEHPMNTNINYIAKKLEIIYMEYTGKLELVRNKSVKQAVAECVKNEAMELKKALVASRELRQFNRLKSEMLRAMAPKAPTSLLIKKEPVYVKNKPRLSNRNKKSKTDIVAPNVLTEAERDYLELFTYWTENEDPEKYLVGVDLEKFTRN